jgi:YidC/Oxa1 family membrane protein insertase
MWATLVELIRIAIFGAAHLCAGSLGSGILLVSFGVRLALLPLTLRLARHARDQQARVAALRPAIEALQRRYAKDPKRLMRETQALHAAHGIRFLSPLGLIGLGVQLPLLGGLYSAVRAGLGTRVRFLWIADLARPDFAILMAATAITAGVAALAPSAPGSQGVATPIVLVAFSALLTLMFLWPASSAVALSFGAGSLVSGLQNWLLDRDRVALAPSA